MSDTAKRTKILWVCNVALPKIAADMGMSAQNIAGWLSGFADELEKAEAFELSICFPILGDKEQRSGRVGNIDYYSFSQPRLMGFLPAEDQLHETPLMRKQLKAIIDRVKPDILHIFGTEYPHSLTAAGLFARPERTLVNIQGLTSYYHMHFNQGIPHKAQRRFVPSCLARGTLAQQEKRLKKRGENEYAALQLAGHVIGRTDWDRACVSEINPKSKYHFCNESLRSAFYTGRWEYEKCEKHSIFMSQAATPIKGLQFMIAALPEILRVYPDTRLYVAGNNILKSDTLYDRLKLSPFAAYIRRLMREKDVAADRVVFTGSLNEQQMKERFLKANVFVSASTIENSPNSLGEAMSLGVPSVTSDVGGVKNLLEHGKEGFVYQADAAYMLAYYVKELFAMEDRASALSYAAQAHALRTHDRDANLKRLTEIYTEILGEQDR